MVDDVFSANTTGEGAKNNPAEEKTSVDLTDPASSAENSPENHPLTPKPSHKPGETRRPKYEWDHDQNTKGKTHQFEIMTPHQGVFENTAEWIKNLLMNMLGLFGSASGKSAKKPAVQDGQTNAPARDQTPLGADTAAATSVSGTLENGQVAPQGSSSADTTLRTLPPRLSEETTPQGGPLHLAFSSVVATAPHASELAAPPVVTTHSAPAEAAGLRVGGPS